VRAFLAIVLVAGLVFLSACGGSGTPVGVQITITLAASANSVAPGQSTTITATVANDTSNKGVTWSITSGGGTLSGQTSTTVVYTAPASVPTPTSATITATSAASSTVTASIQISLQSSAIAVSLSIAPSSAPAGPQTINQGQQLSVSATTNDPAKKGVTWSLSPSTGAGTLTNQTSTAVTYVAPGSVGGNTPVTLTATSVSDANATAALEITVFQSGAGSNVAALNVNSGPAGNSSNIAFVSVTICVPGTTTCQTVDNIQVDTGSAGLRILQSAMPSLSLPSLMDSTGNTIFNCVQFADTSFLWGPVQEADVRIGGEVATATNGELIQTVSTSTAGIPTACSTGSGPGDENTPTTLGANGIIGVGLEPTDCFVQGLVNLCDGSTGQGPPPAYFSCASSGCSSTTTPITIAAGSQVVNPVFLFTDNNGVAIQFPLPLSTPPYAAPTLSGALTFGVNTQTNNMIPSNAILFGLSNDSFITTYAGQTLPNSVIDSGSSALFFPSSLTVCADNAGFFCPPGLTPQSATNQGYQAGAPVSNVNFNIDNADNLFNLTPPDTAFQTLGGPNGSPNTCTSQGTGSCQFDWGLPFFYGQTIFTAIDGQTVNGIGSGPFWAY